jgi:hypothetical protein
MRRLSARWQTSRRAVLDVVMPFRDGLQMGDALHEMRPDLAAILSTAYSFGEVADFARLPARR